MRKSSIVRAVYRRLIVTGTLIIGCLVAGGSLLLAADTTPKRVDLTPADAERVRKVARPASGFSRAEPFEVRSGGAGTTDKLVTADIFSHPSANLDFAGRERFFLGNALFRKDWVQSPASTLASDGLGPLFNARSCQACHVKDGRGHVPHDFPRMEREEPVSLLLRLSVPARTEQERTRLAAHDVNVLPEPTYGGQLQNFAVSGLAAEGSFDLEYEYTTVSLNGGESVTLRKPVVHLTGLSNGPMAGDVMTSLRMAPPMLGLGLLEAIHPADILANVRSDADQDGVSGRPNWVRDRRNGQLALGRFGWKAGQPAVVTQSADAFLHDMGLSTPLFESHWGECTAHEAACLAMPHGAQAQLGDHEVSADMLALVDDYASNLAVPRRRDVDDPRVLAGKQLFYQAHCIACHVPKYVTRRDAERPEHAFQLIWPYTDLLLHDMGPGLADGRPEGVASGSEWRTPPLWGLGLTRTVNERATWLHDGRARTLLEAILWHGGEARPARDRVVAMSPEERADLIRFLESL